MHYIPLICTCAVWNNKSSLWCSPVCRIELTWILSLSDHTVTELSSLSLEVQTRQQGCCVSTDNVGKGVCLESTELSQQRLLVLR